MNHLRLMNGQRQQQQQPPPPTLVLPESIFHSALTDADGRTDGDDADPHFQSLHWRARAVQAWRGQRGMFIVDQQKIYSVASVASVMGMIGWIHFPPLLPSSLSILLNWAFMTRGNERERARARSSINLFRPPLRGV